MSTSGQFENMICEAIETLVDRAVEKAGYDKTIQASIVERTDATIGKYKVKYQDSTFFAYAADVSANYSKGTNVYILIPSNDMEKDKTIIGAVEKLGTDYIPTVPEKNKYDEVGSNFIETTNNGIGVCSYYQTDGFSFLDTSVQNPDNDDQKDYFLIYDANEAIDDYVTLIAEPQIEKYMKDSSYLICGATFRTKLDPTQTQETSGTYGIEFELIFKDSSDKLISKVYRIDNNDMEGFPYHFEKGSPQRVYFPIDGTRFVRINKIQLFCTKFPNKDNSKLDDIFVSNIILQGANKVSEEDLNGCYLTLSTPQGEFLGFSNGGKTPISLVASLKVKGQDVSSDQNVSYYWFRENPKITRESDLFHLYGGLGWECLNKQKSTTIENKYIYDFTPMGNKFDIPYYKDENTKEPTIQSKFATYKCVAVYNENSFSAQKTIQNLNFKYTVELTTDSGQTVFNGTGKVKVICKVSNTSGETENFNFAWAQINSNGQFTSLSSTTNEIEVNMNQILTFATYKCAVYKGDSFVGTAAITLKNEDSQEIDLYSLIINNGSKVYKYNEAGVSPASKRLDNPIKIPALSFTLYDPEGNPTTANENIWYFPKENTMLKLIHTEGLEIKEDLDYYIVKNPAGGTISYSIADTYDPSKTNNTIRLSVKIGDTTYTETTTFLFVREGDSGTNGTDYILRIMPNVSEKHEGDPLIPILTNRKKENEYVWNYNLKNGNFNKQALKLQIWKSEDLIYEGSNSGNITVMDVALKEGETAGTNATLNWVNLIHTYTKNQKDISYIAVSENGGNAIFEGNFSAEENPANIIQARVIYDDAHYKAFLSATLPIITAEVPEAKYRIRYIEGTGFTSVVYSADGMFPQYNKNSPFTIVVEEQDTEGKWLDISENFNYTWNIRGKVNDIDVSSDYLKESRKKAKEPYKYWTIPVDRCAAECLSVAVYCKISNKDGTDFGWIHIPIHFMLNRYGQAALNGWDGNSVEISDEGGYILSPQIGAGKKDGNNAFTGILMGEVKEYKDNSQISHTGIIGYDAGIKSLFINAEDGSAIFGKFVTNTNQPAGGQIIIDPSSEKALLYSSNFFKSYGEDGKPTSTEPSNENKEGLLINLSEPEIRYGNGKFKVDKDGNLTAHSGDIGGWKVGELALYHNGYTVGMGAFNIDDEKYIKSEVVISDVSAKTEIKAVAFWAGGTQRDLEDGTIEIYNPNFLVSHDGYLKATEASIGGIYRNPIFIGTDWLHEYSAMYSGSKCSFNDIVGKCEQGFYLGTDGLAIGSYKYKDSKGVTHTENAFEVTNEGAFVARTGYIGNGESGWHINSTYLNHGEEDTTLLNTIAKTDLFSGKNQDYSTGYQSGIYLGTNGIEVGVSVANLSYHLDQDAKINSSLVRMYGIQVPGFWIKKENVKDESSGSGSATDVSIYDGLVGINSGYLAGTWHITTRGIISDVRNQLYNNDPWFVGQTKPITPEEVEKIYPNETEPERWVSSIPGPNRENDLHLTSSTGDTSIKFNIFSFGVSLLSNAMPDKINRSVGDWPTEEKEGTEVVYSYQRITAGAMAFDAGHRSTVPKNIQCFNDMDYYPFELLDDGSLYARKAVISTQSMKNFNSDTLNGVYIGPEGLSVGQHFKINHNGDIIKGPTPITAIEIVSDLKYNVTTNGGIENYIAILED